MQALVWARRLYRDSLGAVGLGNRTYRTGADLVPAQALPLFVVLIYNNRGYQVYRYGMARYAVFRKQDQQLVVRTGTDLVPARALIPLFCAYDMIDTKQWDTTRSGTRSVLVGPSSIAINRRCW